MRQQSFLYLIVSLGIYITNLWTNDSNVFYYTLMTQLDAMDELPLIHICIIHDL